MTHPQPRRTLVTAALPYANGPVHVGHLAGCYLPADIYVRWLRATGHDVKFICGSDEHGVPITIRAMKEGITPQQVVDKYHAIISKSFSDFGISFDIYSRTSNAIHHQTAADFFTTLYNKGLFEEKETEQFYDEEKQTFLADRYIVGTCPVCANPNAYGDQCERCGTSLSPDQLIDARSALSSNKPVKRKTKHWYFPLNKYQEFLSNWINREHSDWKPNVLGQVKSWLEAGLQPRAMTRDSHWGVKVPLPDAEGKVLYVWFDAPIGYISATKELLPNNWQDYWQSSDTALIHFIGKDNIVFHCVIFPAMLHAHGNFVLPEQVPANEFLNLEGNKVSTSRNWAVWLHEYLEDFKDGEDVLRYYLATIAPETKDSDFTWKGLQEANNSELVSILGNFVNRTWVLMHKLCKGKVPPLTQEKTDAEVEDVFSAIQEAKQNIEALMGQFKFREALAELMNLARKGNQFMQKREPWIFAKQTDSNGAITAEAQQHIDATLHVCLQLCANLAILMQPFLPHTTKKMQQMMKVVDRMLAWENAGKRKLLSTGYSLRPPELLFRKIEEDEIKKQMEKLEQNLVESEASATLTKASEPAPSEPVKESIVFEDFAKIDLRIGTILQAEKVEKADKLLKLEIDLGFERRTIVSGIAQHFVPASLPGKQVVVVANLAPRKMRGIESNGMILLASDPSGKLHFVSPESVITPGSGVS